MSRVVRGRKGAPVAWVNGFFENTIVINGVGAAQFVMVERDDFAAASPVARRVRVVRVVVKAVVVPTIEVTTFAQVSGALAWCVHVQDLDDATDVQMFSTTDNVFTGSDRVIQMGCDGGAFLEIPTAQQGQPYVPGIRVDMDVKMNVTLGPNDGLTLTLQTSESLVGTVTSMDLVGLMRVLVRTD